MLVFEANPWLIAVHEAPLSVERYTPSLVPAKRSPPFAVRDWGPIPNGKLAVAVQLAPWSVDFFTPTDDAEKSVVSICVKAPIAPLVVLQVAPASVERWLAKFEPVKTFGPSFHISSPPS